MTPGILPDITAFYDPLEEQYNSIASSTDPLEALTRNQVDKEEQEYRRKLRSLLIRDPNQLLESKLPQTKGGKASEMLSDLFRAMSQGKNFVPYREIKRQEAMQEYNLQQRNLDTASRLIASEERNQQLNNQLMFRDWWEQQKNEVARQRNEIQAKNAETQRQRWETYKLNVEGSLKDKEKRTAIMQQSADLAENKFKQSKEESPFTFLDNLKQANPEIANLPADDQLDLIELVKQKYRGIVQQGNRGGGGNRTIISEREQAPLRSFDPITGKDILVKQPSLTNRTTIISGSNQQQSQNTIRNILNRNRSTIPITSASPLNQPLQEFTQPLSQTQPQRRQQSIQPDQSIITPIPTATTTITPRPTTTSRSTYDNQGILVDSSGKPVRHNPKAAEENRLKSEAYNQVQNAVNATLEAYKTGELDKIIGNPLEGILRGRLKAGSWGNKPREYLGKMTPNQQAVVGFLNRGIAEDLFAKGGKNLTANEIKWIAPY